MLKIKLFNIYSSISLSIKQTLKIPFCFQTPYIEKIQTLSDNCKSATHKRCAASVIRCNKLCYCCLDNNCQQSALGLPFLSLPFSFIF